MTDHVRSRLPPASPADLHALIQSGSAPVVLDVRTPEEFVQGHIPGAINIPFWRVLSGAAIPVDTDVPLVVYCGHGPRARMAMLALWLRGYRDVRDLDGHMAEWRRLGLPEAKGMPGSVRP